MSIQNHSDSNEEELERQHFQRIINSFAYYRCHSLKRVLTAEKHYSDMPLSHQELIPNFRERLKKIRNCIEENYTVIKLILAYTENMFENKDHGPAAINDCTAHPASEFDMDKVKTTLKQFVRDWSSDGLEERKASYQPVINEIVRLFPPDECNAEQISVLVPGAGLGRLAFEIARLGYACQGNEFSLFMLFASNFVLNKCKEVNMFTLYPFVHQYCNNLESCDQILPVKFPDTNPADLPAEVSFSMAAGDFLEVYTEPENWDCVVSVFFLDTAHNVLAYIETIWHILKPGGYFINLGPLLYHFADMPNESSIEISYEDLRNVIIKFGFEIVKEDTNHVAHYTQNPRSMLQYQYNCVFFVARKPLTMADS